MPHSKTQASPHAAALSGIMPSDAVSPRVAMIALFIRLHFYIGIFVGPFIFIAALTGTLYVLTPQIENRLYAHQLFTQSHGAPQPLEAQILAAQSVLGHHHQARLTALRPAPAPGETTRVMFASPELGPSESRAIFIDPVSLEIRGDETVYGTSGILPFRTWLDYLHRGLLLGDIGRSYSELAASWLWVAALGGVLIWGATRHSTTTDRRRNKKAPRTPAAQKRRLRRRHTGMGLCLLLGLLFFSATGLTWSKWAGSNISLARSLLGWQTPALQTQLISEPMTLPAHHHGADSHPMPADEHAEHHAPMPMPHAVDNPPEMFDRVWTLAREAGIDAQKIEIKPAARPGQAWTVSEIDRAWPTQVDAVAINPATLEIVDKTDFTTFPLAAKLTRWGVDAHMGVLFGLPNQILLAAFGLGLCAMIVWGYRMWWLRRPRHRGGNNPLNTLTGAFLQVRFFSRVLLAVISCLLAVCLPVMGVSLLLFILIDVIRWQRSRTVASKGA
ncbi:MULTISPECIES: PepSY-associated TM helix domain-containing protein [Brenneria]|uniref:PepSY domain-containing protein n=1 Tax=Brenneria nigrifluens DSM 30175 = ATCC 13028 TaxID=1121120 RepID=A0A2U1URY0_9GAMM|nr:MULTISPECIES: PepSY-associated TM helix domain-containing protein [Brenneria]EHD21013.1 PepSY-associated TM helix domain protein [Brenneria sp. EniD312]PWC24439.1 PepSY domain-containing protein [Brenneria nigrifluens DSM 30175 = ATCC 13028]QCR04168.1 PepSY domain-containing protein [Brenneria nigrifluens DSM 30175 = ATCC 13028]